MPAPTLDEFLKRNVEGYLLGDIKSMSGPQPAGGCGYPLLMTVCSGIELLGALSSNLAQPFKTHGMGDKYFLDYWENALYPKDPLRAAGEVVYQLVRHGLAHSFVTKGDVLVINEAGKPHFTQTAAGVVINSNHLASEFTRSYHDEFVAKRLATNRAAMEKRFGEVWNEYEKQAKKLWHLLAPLPASPPVAGVSGSAQTSSPPAVTPGGTSATLPTTNVSRFGN